MSYFPDATSAKAFLGADFDKLTTKHINGILELHHLAEILFEGFLCIKCIESSQYLRICKDCERK